MTVDGEDKTMKQWLQVIGLASLALSMTACGGGDSGTGGGAGNGPGGASSTGGATATGGASTGGATTGGTGGAPATAGHCSPGKTIFPGGDYPITPCSDLVDGSAYKIAPGKVLAKEIGLSPTYEPGQKLAVSVDVLAADPGATVEIYSESVICGEVGGKLYSAPIATGVFCADITYSYGITRLFVVFRNTAEVRLGPATVCHGGTCPAK